MLDPFPLLLSLRVATVATLLNLSLGIGLAWVLARWRFPGQNLVETLVTLPMVMPPTVLGYYLLVLLGSQSALGRWLQESLGMRLVFTWYGAVVAAMVSSFPLFVEPARAALQGVDRRLEDAARTLGRSEWAVFFTITLPLAWRGIFAGVVLAFARALGDFGATLMVAGNIPDRTQTMALAIYDAVQAGNQAAADRMVLVMTVGALLFLWFARRLSKAAVMP
jgi:molybdate transport system permease protein